MHPDSGTRAMGNVLALLIIAGLAVYGLESCGVRTGIPELAICRVGQSVVMETGRGLLPLGLIAGFVLLIIPFSRGAGITLLVASIGGMVMVDVWAQHAGAYCSSSTGGGGFTP